ncbi:metB, partial [Symbiodinium sp. CCMP2456]
ESVEKYLDKGYSYSRTNNPTVTALEEKLAKVENGRPGLSMNVISDCSYGGTNRSCREFFTPLNMEFDFVDFRDPENVKKAMKPNTKLVFSETPANPVLRGP